MIRLAIHRSYIYIGIVFHSKNRIPASYVRLESKDVFGGIQIDLLSIPKPLWRRRS